MMRILPIETDLPTLSRYTVLFSKCFPESAKFNPTSLDWLYRQNPDGKVIGFDAWDGERLAAHYACVPARASVGGSVVNALLSLNTATDPDYQGQGLFTRLAQTTYQRAEAEGIDCIFGVANANSTPGFLRKLGFQLVEPLQARVGVGSLGLDLNATAEEIQFERVWSDESIAWRCANPANPVSCRARRDRFQFHAAAVGRLLSVYSEMPLHRSVAALQCRSFPLLRLYLGLVPTGKCRFRSFVEIPKRFRPSPLNFIYRSLSKRVERLQPGRIRFSFLDFDAY